MAAKGLLLKYNAPNPGDGAGAQFQRILGIYATAKSNHLGYLHAPIQHLGANAGDGFESMSERIAFTGELNQLINLESDSYFRNYKEITLRRINPRLVWMLRPARKILETLRISIILKIDSTLQWVDQNAWCYDSGISPLHSRFVLPRPNETRLIVDVHIRRAGIPMQDLLGRDYGRWTPTHWYVNILNEIKRNAESSGKKLLIRVHTDTLNSGSTWTPPADISPETMNHWKDIGVLTLDGQVSGLYENFSEIFSKYGDVQMVQNISAIEAWKMMIQSDILIIAKSSMSYVAALFRTSKPVIYAKFWHTGLTNWNLISTAVSLTEIDKKQIYSLTKVSLIQQKSLMN